MRSAPVSAIVCCIALAAGLSACAATDASGVRSHIAAGRSSLDEARSRAVAELAAATAAGDSAAAAVARATIQAADTASSRLDKAAATLSAATNPDGSLNVGGAASVASALLPPPWNIVLLLGGPALAALLQELRVRRAAADANSIVAGIEAAKASNPALGAALKASAPVLLAHYTDAAHARVEAARP